MKKKLEIWGSLPEPYGGVSVHVQRLILALGNYDNVKLINFSTGKQIINQKNIKKGKSFFNELLRVIFRKNIMVHLHSNRLIVLLLFSLLKKNNYIVTLHNKRFLNFDSSKKQLFLASLKKARYVFSNDDEVHEILMQKKINTIKVPAFLPPISHKQKIKLPEEFIIFRNKYRYVFSLSIYGFNYLDNDDYGLKKIIALLKKINNPTVGFCLCISQPNLPDLEQFINDAKKEGIKNNLLLLINKIANGSDIWAQSDAFLRLNNTDIEGLSVKEALLLNVPVLASNVCSRPKDAIVYDVKDSSDLESKFADLVENLEIYKEELRKSNKSDIVSALDIIQPIYRKVLK